MADNKEFDPNLTVDSSDFIERTLAIVCPSCGLEVTGGFDCCPNDGTRLVPDLERDKSLSERYDSLELIGEGGMSAIYKARHKLMKRTVAIKLLHSHFHSSPDTIKRFQQEAEAVSTMSHDNVVNVFDFGQLQHGQPFMVMSYISGKSLAQVIKAEGALDLYRSLKLFVQVCMGLEHAHKRHIVHRDLKPTNVMLTTNDAGEEKAIIVDFGIAKIMAEGEQTVAELTKTGAVLGSPYYMSPEQCLGRHIDSRSDIYSLGCLMYETLTGKPLFSGGSALETMHKHVNEKAPLMQTMLGFQALKNHMQAVITHAVEKDPGNRYQNISDLLADLQLLQNAVEKNHTVKLTALKACSSHKLKKWSAAALCFLVLVLGINIYTWNPFSTTHLPARPEPKKIVANGDADLKTLLKTNPKLATLEADGISDTGMPDIAAFSNLHTLKLIHCTAHDTALAALTKLPDLKDLTLADSKIDDKSMVAIEKLQALQTLDVACNNMSPAVLVSLAKLKNLQELTLHDLDRLGPDAQRLSALQSLTNLNFIRTTGVSDISDADVQVIAKSLPGLSTLKLEGTQVGDLGLNSLSQMPSLEHLSLAFCAQVKDDGLKALLPLRLKWLNLNGTDITDKGLETLGKFKYLEQLFFWHTRVNNEGLEYLAKIKTLKVLHLTYTKVSDQGVAKLIGLDNLIDLKLRQTLVSDDGLKLLKNLPHLLWLNLQQTQITDAGIKALQDIKTLEELDISQDTDITDAGFKQLAAIKTLKHIYIKETNISPEAIKEFEIVAPNCQVHSKSQMHSRSYD